MDPKEFLILVEDCEKRESRLNDWERSFIDSIRKQLEKDRPLSPKQDECLTRIWGKATEKG